MTNGGLEIVCECGDGTCIEQIPIPSAEYFRIRTDATLFILVSGHEDATAEAVVEEEPPYLVVRKHPPRPTDLTA